MIFTVFSKLHLTLGSYEQHFNYVPAWDQNTADGKNLEKNLTVFSKLHLTLGSYEQHFNYVPAWDQNTADGKNLEENLAICTLVNDKVAILQRLPDCQMICHLKIRNGSLISKTCFQFCSYQL